MFFLILKLSEIGIDYFSFFYFLGKVFTEFSLLFNNIKRLTSTSTLYDEYFCCRLSVI